MLQFVVGRNLLLLILNLYSFRFQGGKKLAYFTCFTAAGGQPIFLTKQGAEIVIKTCAFLEPLMN